MISSVVKRKYLFFSMFLRYCLYRQYLLLKKYKNHPSVLVILRKPFDNIFSFKMNVDIFRIFIQQK